MVPGLLHIFQVELLWKVLLPPLLEEFPTESDVLHYPPTKIELLLEYYHPLFLWFWSFLDY